MRESIKLQLDTLPMSERIAIVESLGKEYRRKNSVRINEKQMGRHTDSDRPDLQIMK